ncbi:MAG: ABC transporter permease [Phycisphaerae bacterium]|nr:ABC transporter permease [Phycisphaerae bacterium]
MLAKNPGFSVFVVIILTVGIGATTVMLSVVDAIMFRACPYRDSEHLVCLYETNPYVDPATGAPKISRWNFTSIAGFRDWREQSHVFERLVGADQWNGMVRTIDRTERCRGHFVSPEFFSVLGASPILGRTFLPEEYRQRGRRVVILSHDHWRHWFASDPNVIGETLILDREAYTVVGVLPEDFQWIFQPIACGLWMPMPLDTTTNTNRNNRGMNVIGRLKSGVSIAQARMEMELITERLAQAYPETNASRGIRVVPIDEAYAHYTGNFSKPQILTTVLAVIVSVLLIACFHVSSLLIARSATREREIAVRAALGAHRLRLIRQLLTESILLALLGGLFGGILAYWGLSILSIVKGQSIPWYLGPGSERLIPWFVNIHIDARSFFYVTALSLLTCGAFGLLPALSISKTNLNRSLSAGRTSGYVPWSHSLRSMLVVLDISIAFVLLIGAGLMINGYVRILRIDPKADTENVLVATLELQGGEERYSTSAQRFEFSRRLMERIQKVPGVQSIAIANGTPASMGYNWDKFIVEGFSSSREGVKIRCTPISRDYFRLLRIPVLRGRQFTEHDNSASTPVAIINESLAKRLWPNQNPLGKCLTHGASEPVTREVVGVTRDVRHFGDYPNEEVYIPCLQTNGFTMLYPDVMIRTDARTTGLTVAVRREILSVDPDIFIRQVTFLDRQIADLFTTERLSTLLLGVFAAAALVLASVGIYGATAYMVSRRTHEIGVRMALGARSGDVLKSVLRQGLKLTLIGLAIGLVGAFVATRIIRSLLHNVSPTDPLTFICVSFLLSGVALLASYIPARRAAKTDPMEALRYE